MHDNHAPCSGWFSCQMVPAMRLIHALHSETPECEGCLFVKQPFAALVEGQQQGMIYGLHPCRWKPFLMLQFSGCCRLLMQAQMSAWTHHRQIDWNYRKNKSMSTIMFGLFVSFWNFLRCSSLGGTSLRAADLTLHERPFSALDWSEWMKYIHFGVNTELLVFFFLLPIPHVMNESHDCNNMRSIHVVVPETLMCSSRVYFGLF